MLPSKTFLTKTYAVTDDFFIDGVLQMAQIAKITEDIATTHANQLGFGFDDMFAKGLLWVISRAKFVFYAPITHQIQRIIVTTWPAPNRKSFCNRYYVATDDNGNRLFSAVYLWTVIDVNTRRMGNADVMQIVYNANFDTAQPDMDMTVDKIAFTNALDGWFLDGQHLVERDLLDANNHLNNTHYVAFATFGESKRITELQITFKQELRLGQTVCVYKKRVDGAVQAVGLSPNGEQTYFTAKYVVW